MNFFFINIENNRETRAILALIIGIENFILNFQKLKAALQNTFCGLKLILLDFADDETHRGNMTTIDLNATDKHLEHHVMHSFCDELVMNKKVTASTHSIVQIFGYIWHVSLVLTTNQAIILFRFFGGAQVSSDILGTFFFSSRNLSGTLKSVHSFPLFKIMF